MAEEGGEDAELDALFGGVEDEENDEGEGEEDKNNREENDDDEEEGEGAASNAGAADADGGSSATPAPALPEPVVPLKQQIVDFVAKMSPEQRAQYVSVTASLMIETRPFSEEQFEASMTSGQAGATSAEGREHPWRVIRWRETADKRVESNARMVTWSDGSQSIFIGNKTVYDVAKQPMRRGTNDLVNMCVDDSNGFVMTHFARMDERLVFRLEKEPIDLKKYVPDKKARKVKIVGGVSKEEEERQLQEEDKRRSSSRLERKKDLKQKQTSSAALDRQFLEDGLRKDEYEREGIDDEEGDDGEGGSTKKRGRAAVEEDRILRAKKPAPAKPTKKKEEDGINLYDEDDDDEDLQSFIDDDDEEGAGAGGVIGSDSE